VRRQDDRSILDSLRGSLSRLKVRLDPADRLRLDEYAQDVREIERRLQIAKKAAVDAPSESTVPVGVPESFDEHIKLQFDLLTLAFQADITRVSTLLYARDLPGVTVSSTFQPGAKTGQTDLVMVAHEAKRPFVFTLGGNNYGTELTGRYRAQAGAAWNSPLGIGDQLTANVDYAFDPRSNVYGALGYRIPTVVVPGHGAVYAVQSVIPSTPWLIVLYQSERSILQKPHDFLRGLLLAGLFVLALATVAAWFLGRLVTRPLREVTSAASDLALGDYTRRVDVHGGGREVAQLATMFNAMAAATGDAHAVLAERNAELQRANAAKAQFLAMMSHELRTPLNAIGGFTELMELGLRGPVTPEQVEDLGRIRRNKDLLVSIITDILDFSRTDAGALTIEMEPVAIAPLITDVVDAVRTQMAAKGVELEADDVPPDAVVRGDRKKILQVLLNLLSNAMKFTEPGGEVGIDTVVDEGTVRIDVRDTGSGISAAQLETIFEPFVQVDASLTRRTGGTGLGLAIARQLTRAMGGTVTVRSQLGAGSTFSLTLPRAELPVVPRPDDRHTPRETSQVV